MRVVIQRVKQDSVDIDGCRHAEIKAGLLVLLGIEDRDTDADIDYLCHKIVAMRIFDDEQGVMNLPVTQTDGGEVLVVSQFTLVASTRKGNRPSYIRASKPDFGANVRAFLQYAFPTVGSSGSDGCLWRRYAGGARQRRSCHHYYGQPVA